MELKAPIPPNNNLEKQSLDLENKRFKISQETLNFLKQARLDLQELQKTAPFIYGFGFFGYGFGDQLRIDVVSARIDVDENGFGAEAGDAAAGGEKGVGRGDDFVAGADTEAHQSIENGIGAAGGADGELAVAVGGDGFFQGLDLRPADADLAVENLVNGRANLVAQLGVLSPQIQ